MREAYTIGNPLVYDHIIEEGVCYKVGAQPPGYDGGYVWRTHKEAQRFINENRLEFPAVVYMIELPNSWEDDVSEIPECESPKLLNNARILCRVQLEKI